MLASTVARVQLRARDLTIAYDDVGAGPPVVFIHGGLGNRAMWRPQLAGLAPRHRCLAYDLRGHGETRGGEDAEAYTPALLRDDLLGFLDELGLERVALVGLSVGGLVAQEAAIAAPGRFTRVVLADTWVVTAPGERSRLAGRILAPVVEGALLAAGTAPLAWVAARAMGAERPEAAALVRAATAGTSRRAAVRVARGLAVHDTRARLGRARVPALVLAGSEDGNLAQSRLLAALLPDARLEVLEGAGHVSNLHAPEAFTAAVERFLAPLP